MKSIIRFILPALILLFACNNQTQESAETDTASFIEEETLTETEETKQTSPLEKSKTISSDEYQKLVKSLDKNSLILDVNDLYIDKKVKELEPVEAALIEKLKIKEYTKPFHDGFTYYIADTLQLIKDIDSYIIIQYYDMESFIYLFNFRNEKVNDYQLIYYDNDEGCRATDSKIFKNGIIQLKLYDCSMGDETIKELYSISENGEIDKLKQN